STLSYFPYQNVLDSFNLSSIKTKDPPWLALPEIILARIELRMFGLVLDHCTAS
ncbi:hypothetical protein SCLCIDRAFT_1208546, partial [Scleroderma citrinum Foug A]